MDTNQDVKTGDLSRLKDQAQRCVVEQDGKYVIRLDSSIQGLDTSKIYDSRELAVDTAFNFLKNRVVRAA